MFQKVIQKIVFSMFEFEQKMPENLFCPFFGGVGGLPAILDYTSIPFNLDHFNVVYFIVIFLLHMTCYFIVIWMFFSIPISLSLSFTRTPNKRGCVFLVPCKLSSVSNCTRVYWTWHFFQGTRKNRAMFNWSTCTIKSGPLGKA